MIPVSNTLVREDHMPAIAERKFSIGDPRWVMESLADLYSDKELATIRELSTNARDANIEIGNDEPIRITLPTSMNPYFIVEDKGVGMSQDTLLDVYTSFGVSTKRDSNDYNGMLGFGSKAPIAYTNSFTVTSVHNGRKTVAMITRNESKEIVLKVLMDVASTDHSGTRIEIPVHNHEEFAHKAKDFYKFWKPGTVLVDGAQPATRIGEKINDTLYYLDNGGYNESYVVMGNVPYRINNPRVLFPSGVKFINFIAYVPNGTVEFTPNREALKYGPYTDSALRRVVTNFITEMRDNAQKKISEAKTHYEAYALWQKFKGIIGDNFGEVRYRGEVLKPIQIPFKGQEYDKNQYRGSTCRVDHIKAGYMRSGLVITDFDKTLASNHKRDVKDYSNLNGLDVRWFYFTKDSFESKWVDPKRVIKWDDLKASLPVKPKAKRPKVAAGYGRKAGTFDIFDPKTGSLKFEQEIPQGDITYVSVQQWNELAARKEQFRSADTVFEVLGMTAPVIKVPANRLDKFLREYPHAVNAVKKAKSLTKTSSKGLLTEEAMEVQRLDYSMRNLVARFADKTIDDPRWMRYHGLIARENELMKPVKMHQQACRLLNIDFVMQSTNAQPLRHFHKDYPLLEALSYRADKSEAIIYINAKYKEIK